jgi:aryl-alcohol dehydrogenase-like predicted oxidoreductase
VTSRRIGPTSLDVFPLCLGGNVFGWTVDEAGCIAVLDAFAAAGGNFVDTADVYCAWVPGNSGGESETLIGRWMRARTSRQRMIIATKVGKLTGLEGLAPATIRQAVEGSLARLGTDYIDIYYAHADDPQTPLVDTLRAFDELVREGKVRHIAASNYSAPRLAEALEMSAREGLASYVLLQPSHNLMQREVYEGALRDVCVKYGVSCAPYYSLANGFLTGKYRPGAAVESVRARRATAFLDDRGIAMLSALDDIAASHRTTVAAVALAWLVADETIAAPIASARTPAQLADLLPVASLTLRPDEVARLSSL